MNKMFLTEVYYVRQQNNVTSDKKQPRYIGPEMIISIGKPAFHWVYSSAFKCLQMILENNQKSFISLLVKCTIQLWNYEYAHFINNTMSKK